MSKERNPSETRPGRMEPLARLPVFFALDGKRVVLAGGSAFGLDAATGVMRYLVEQGVGFVFGDSVVPIVPAAIIFDLSIGRTDVRPDADAGYAAASSASARCDEGSVGAGAGATVGKALGPDRAMKGGAGTASERTIGGLIAGALAVGLASGVGQYAMAVFTAAFIMVTLWVIESFEPEGHKLFELKIKMGEETDERRKEFDAILDRFHVDFDLLTSSDEEVVYEVSVPLEMQKDRLSNALLRLDPEGHGAVEWTEKKPKKK